jgi:hypothetical protein
MEEYELLRGVVCELPPRATTQGEIERIKKQMERIQEEGVKYAAIMEVRRLTSSSSTNWF